MAVLTVVESFPARGRAYVANQASVHARVEALHHLFAIDPDAAAAECEALDRELMVNPEWEQALALSLQEGATAGWRGGSGLGRGGADPSNAGW